MSDSGVAPAKVSSLAEYGSKVTASGTSDTARAQSTGLV